MPCFVSGIDETSYFRYSEFTQLVPSPIHWLIVRSGPSVNSPMHTTRKPLFQLEDLSDPARGRKIISLQQRTGVELRVPVAGFKPHPGDKLAHKWMTSTGEQSLEMPHFCLADIGIVKFNVRRYVLAARRNYLSVLGAADDLTWKTITMAIQYAETHQASDTSLITRWAQHRLFMHLADRFHSSIPS